MPVTAKLSHKLYEAFGDEAASEMIDWIQRVDTRRSEFREMHQLTTARFESRLAELDAKIQSRETKIEPGTADVIKWSFGFWVGSVVTLMVALVTLTRFLR